MNELIAAIQFLVDLLPVEKQEEINELSRQIEAIVASDEYGPVAYLLAGRKYAEKLSGFGFMEKPLE